jgi:hypothetical protein
MPHWRFAHRVDADTVHKLNSLGESDPSHPKERLDKPVGYGYFARWDAIGLAMPNGQGDSLL